MRRIVAVTAVAVIAVGSLPAVAGGTAPSGHHGHARAVAEAKALLTDAPTIESATPSASAPVKRLDHGPSRVTYSDFVERARYWTVDESETQAFVELTASTPKGYRETERGRQSGRRPDDTIEWEGYEPTSLRPGIAYAQLIVAVTPTGQNAAAIGAYGQAVPRPHRPASEYVPHSVHKVVVSKSRSGHKRTVQRTVRSKAAHQLVRDFNKLLAAPRGGVSNGCTSDPATETATFRSHGNVWVASTGGCVGVNVVRDGKALPTLDSSKAFNHDLNAAIRRR